MFASCVGCGVYTPSARETRDGLMCRPCAAFLTRDLRELDAPQPLSDEMLAEILGLLEVTADA